MKVRVESTKSYRCNSGEFNTGIKAYVDITLKGYIIIEQFKMVQEKIDLIIVGFPSKKSKDKILGSSNFFKFEN